MRELVEAELAKGRESDAFPLKPQRIVNDIRAAMGDEDIVLADTGAIKMWMARLYPTYAPLTCIVSNGLSYNGVFLARGHWGAPGPPRPQGARRHWATAVSL